MGGESVEQEIPARLWVLNLSDGEHSLLDLADRSGLPFRAVHDAARFLQDCGLIALRIWKEDL